MVERWENIRGGIARAPRFPLMLSMLYRPSGESAWHAARTENISRSGVLFRGERPLDLYARVEMAFVLPAKVSGQTEAHVICSGRVVRVAAVPSGDAGVPVAAAITEYRFANSEEIVDL